MSTRILLLGLILFGSLPLSAIAQTDGDESFASSTNNEDASDLWYEIEPIMGRIDVGDFVVGPGRTEVEIQPGQTLVQYVTVTNRISDERSFQLQIEDITGTADGSAAVRVLEGERGPYSVQDYMSFPEEAITLKLGERARIPVTISVPEDAEPGGYYGSVLVSTIRTGQSAAGAPRNPIIARVGSHFFITVPGEQLTDGSLIDLSITPTQLWHESGPISFALAYENTGSIHVNPYGELRIYNTFGSEVGYQALEPWFVLPKSIRTREVDWNREFLFGRYVAEAAINRGYEDIIDTRSVVFWVLPWRFLLIVAVSICLITFLLRLFFKTFEFKRRG